MLLYDVFPPTLIKIGLDSDDKDEVFEEMVDKFCQVQQSNARKEILDAIWEREGKMSTGIYKGIAIPHGRTTAIEEVHGILGISRKGIDYDALDNQPVYLLFMLIAPEKDSEKHLKLLKRLAGLVENTQFYDELLAQADPNAAHGILKKYEDIYISSY